MDISEEEKNARHRARCKAYRDANIERWREYDRQRRSTAEGHAKKMAMDKDYYHRTKDEKRESERLRRRKAVKAKREYDIRYRAANAERVKQRQLKYYAANKPAYYARVQERNARELQATPRWANRFFIEEAYRLADLRARLTGIDWDVDHIVPLRSPLVCGLHVEHNLRVIPASENRSKGNRYWPDMP